MCTSYLILTLNFVFNRRSTFMDEISVAATAGVMISFAFGPAGCIACLS
jgi:hypothetical protein